MIPSLGNSLHPVRGGRTTKVAVIDVVDPTGNVKRKSSLQKWDAEKMKNSEGSEERVLINYGYEESQRLTQQFHA